MKKMSLMVRQIVQISIPIITLIIALVVIGVSFSGILGDLATTFETESFTSIGLVLNADRDYYQALTGYDGLFIYPEGSDEYAESLDAFYGNIVDVDSRMKEIQQIASQNADLGSLSLTAGSGTVNSMLDEFFDEFDKWQAASESVVAKLEGGASKEDLLDDIANTVVLFDAARGELNSIGEVLELYPSLLSSKSISSSNNTQLVIYIVVGIAALISIAYFVISTRKLVGAIDVIAVKEGDLAENLMGASYQLATSSQQLSEGSNEQAASIEETSATMEETSSMVQQNAENTRQANNLSKEASEAAHGGSDKMIEMTKSMEELKKSSGDISKIIKVIDDIAFQTNMLALNAAVEAARAGDAGQGFAVVAEEVRNLAQKSAKAAKDTAEIIDRNIELSERGVSISEDVNVSLKEIMEKSMNVNQLMGEIAAASEEQARGTSQITEAIGQMEKVVQINASTAEESASSAEELQNQAQSLRDVVMELNDLVKGQDNQTQIGSSPQKAISSVANNAVTRSSSRKQIVSADDVIPFDDNDDF